MRILIAGALSIIFSAALYADTRDDAFHFTAHFGGTYAISNVTEVLCKQIVGNEHKLGCLIAGTAVGNGVNVAYKAQQKFPHDTKRALTAGALGSAATGLLFISF